MLAIVTACALLTYGGVSLFVVAFAVYPFAATLFRQARIPKRLIPGTIALGAFTFTMDALPGTPQIQNVIPTTFFGTTIYAAPVLGILGAVFVLTLGLLYLEWRRRRAGDEGYGEGHKNEPELDAELDLPHPLEALLPLLTVAAVNRMVDLKARYGPDLEVAGHPVEVAKVAGVWSIELALAGGILVCLALGYRRIGERLRRGLELAVSGALLASLNTASEYGFGGVIAALPGFALVKTAIASVSANPLVNEAVSINVLAGITGSASGGLSIALAAMGNQYLASGIAPEVLHRIASMASGGMDTLPHNGAVITLLVITGLSHRQSYKDIFALTLIKTLSVFFVIAVHCLTGWC
jgi:H+/gluconate symporter-like permease